jgi:type II secretory pathway pseudopilin PulG
MGRVLLLEAPTSKHQAYSRSTFRSEIDSSARDGSGCREWGSAAWTAGRGQSCSRLFLLGGRPADEPKWAGPYLAKLVPADPWGRAYIYQQPGTGNHDFELLSQGKDGQAGGTGLQFRFVAPRAQRVNRST